MIIYIGIANGCRPMSKSSPTQLLVVDVDAMNCPPFVCLHHYPLVFNISLTLVHVHQVSDPPGVLFY